MKRAMTCFAVIAVLITGCRGESSLRLSISSDRSISLVSGYRESSDSRMRLTRRWTASEGQALALDLRGTGEGRVLVSSRSGDDLVFDLPRTDLPVFQCRFPLPEGFALKNFELQSGSSDSRWQIVRASIKPQLTGFDLGDRNIFSPGIIIKAGDDFLRFSPNQKKGDAGIWSFTTRSESEADLILRCRYLSGDQDSYRWSVRPGDQTVTIDLSEKDGVSEFSVEGSGARSVLSSVRWSEPDRRRTFAGGEPLVLDFGMMIWHDDKSWHRKDWELFRWNVSDSVYVMAFRDLKTQASYLKRLAFFVEKQGFAGNLIENEVLEPLHGWNAHDYWSRDLARFFNQAEEEGFPLNREERELKELLILRGLLADAGDGRVTSLGGGLLSYSLESSPYLQYFFLNHEGMHGLYFTNEDFRRGCGRVWDGLSDNERAFWRTFLAWRGYNPDDEDLMINEFQAYHLQGKIENVDDYFWKRWIPRLLTAKPEAEEIVGELQADHRDTFVRSAELLGELLERTTGQKAGTMGHLWPIRNN